MTRPSTNATATNAATRISVEVRRNLCLTSSSLKCRRLLNTNAFLEFTRALQRQSLARRRVTFLVALDFDAAEPEPNDSVSGFGNRRSALSILPTSARDTPKAGRRNSDKLRR